ncbi:hypothetical protein D3C80_1347180 [compost metagenome]
MLIRPWLRTAPPPPVMAMSPSMNLSSAISSVEATNPPALILPVLVIRMPLGLTRKTCPLAFIAPAIRDWASPVTRLSRTESAPSCWMSTWPPSPIEKLFQLMMARSLPWVMVITPGAAVPMLA